jgi:hypothetical protein
VVLAIAQLVHVQICLVGLQRAALAATTPDVSSNVTLHTELLLMLVMMQTSRVAHFSGRAINRLSSLSTRQHEARQL